MTAVARKMPEPCAYVAARHQLPWGENGPGDHDWFQVKADIWCRVCGADYDDESRTHVMFAPKPRPVQLELFERFK